jgi:hypothetical protein
VEVGATLRPGNGTPFALESQLNEDSWRVDETYIPSQGQVGVFVPRGGFHRSDHRLPSFSQARHRGRQALSEPKPWGNRTTPLPRVINTDKDHRLPAGHRRTQSRGRSGGERIVRCGTLTTSWNRITGPSSAGSAPASIFAPSGEPGARRAGYEAMHIDSQRPGVLECGGCEGRSTAPLHSRSVCCDDLIADPTTPIFGSTTKSQHFRRTAMYSISGCTILVVMIRIKRAFTF